MRISSNRVKFLGQLKLACAIPLALPTLSSMVRSLHSPPEGYWRASLSSMVRSLHSPPEGYWRASVWVH
jgi:hypothetical protein